MKKIQFKRTFIAVTALLVLASSVGAPAAAQTYNDVTAANDAQTTTQAATTTAVPTTTEAMTTTQAATTTETMATTESAASQSACEAPASPPSMEQARLYAAEKTIEKTKPGQIAGGFQVDPTATCPVVVHVTMSVPSGMTIQGSSDIFTGGAGMVSGNFEVRPQGGIKDIRANVYSTNTGTRTVTADIQYWPKGHKDMAREIDGMSFTFDVKEPVEATVESGNSSSDNSGNTTTVASSTGGSGGLPLSQNMLIIVGLMFILLVAVLAMTKMSPRDINIGVKK
ncbi:hypothetical protein [Halorussus pelagicus]|uniref:hypothetical protein n=1 Tax=Halorussus pelagicus TaxID=2505977 RepID=UPI000FFBD6F7|nr:hypothetical protein [Halorussus pelagicus]